MKPRKRKYARPAQRRPAQSARDVHLAVLEEAEHISAVGVERPPPAGKQGDIEG